LLKYIKIATTIVNMTNRELLDAAMLKQAMTLPFAAARKFFSSGLNSGLLESSAMLRKLLPHGKFREGVWRFGKGRAIKARDLRNEAMALRKADGKSPDSFFGRGVPRGLGRAITDPRSALFWGAPTAIVGTRGLLHNPYEEEFADAMRYSASDKQASFLPMLLRGIRRGFAKDTAATWVPLASKIPWLGKHVKDKFGIMAGATRNSRGVLEGGRLNRILEKYPVDNSWAANIGDVTGRAIASPITAGFGAYSLMDALSTPVNRIPKFPTKH
jgi:hypothetical protein